MDRPRSRSHNFAMKRTDLGDQSVLGLCEGESGLLARTKHEAAAT
jgi:hypothetical protein